MKCPFRVVLLLALLLAPAARAAGPDDQYLGIYYLIQEADSLTDKEQFAPALAKYNEAETQLKNFHLEFPDWYTNVVEYRLNYLDTKIDQITPKIPPPVTNAVAVAVPAPLPVPVPTEKPQEPGSVAVAVTSQPAPTESAPVTPADHPIPTPAPVAPAPNPAPNQASNDDQNMVRDLQAQLQQALADKSLLEAKLKEALSVRPAPLDPQELSRAQDEIRELQKESALYQTSYEQLHAKSANAELASAANASLRNQLADAQGKAAELAQANTELTRENAKLAAQSVLPASVDPETKALRDENAALKRQMAELKKNTPATDADAAAKLHAAQAQVATLESDMDILRLENTALEDRARETAQGETIPQLLAADTNETRIKLLETERDNLQQRLDVALSEIAAGKASHQIEAQADSTGKSLADLRERLAVLEAKPVPYTPEELTLMDRPMTAMFSAVAHTSGKKQPGELPAKARGLLADAKRAVANHDLAEAEAKYLEILKLDENNVAALADLASIQVDLNHLTEAEGHIETALTLEPENEYCLFVLGRLRFQQQKYDDALDALSHAAQLNPENAEIQNYLGITLSEKGLREPAEAALRKAVQIDPNFASAHANLAFVYITEQPPFPDLARWHYEKALAAGYPPNPKIEKLLGSARSSTADAPSLQP